MTVAIVAVPCASLCWASRALATGGCAAAPGSWCCLAERLDAAAGSTTQAATAAHRSPAWLALPVAEALALQKSSSE